MVGLARSQRFMLSLLSSRQKELVEENTRLRKQVGHADRFDRIITQSHRITLLVFLARHVGLAHQDDLIAKNQIFVLPAEILREFE